MSSAGDGMDEADHGMTTLERLVYMANQIARNFAVHGHDTAATETANHIDSFWDRDMKARIIAWRASGAEGLSPAAADAIDQLAAR